MTAGYYAQFAPRLVDLGYGHTTVARKKPLLRGWSRRLDNARDYEANGSAYVGVLCNGPHNLIAIDVDVKNLHASNQLQALAKELHVERPRRVHGRADPSRDRGNGQ